MIPPSGQRARQLLNRRTAVVLALAALGVLVASADDYGLTYDEPVYMSRAMRAAQWLGLLWQAPGEAIRPEAITRLWDATGDEQPGLMKLIAGPTMLLSAPVLPPLAAMRTATMLLSALLVGVLYAFVAGVWRRTEAVFAAAGLLLLPRVFAHCHLLAQDAPVMAWSFMAVAATYQYARKLGSELPSDARPYLTERPGFWLAAMGLAFGAAVATKVNGLFVPAIAIPWLAVYRRRAVLPALGAMVVLGSAVFFGSWPWLWVDSVERLARYFAFFGQHYAVQVTYFGEVYARAPWHYPLVMTAITTPPMVLALAVAGLCSRGQADGEAGADWSQSLGGLRSAALALMAWAVIVHIVPGSLPDSPKYNGVRLFLPVFPPLMVLAAAGFGLLARAAVRPLASSLEEERPRVMALMVLALLPLLAVTARTHPYCLSYYNAFIGGPSGAVARGMEATYWGETYAAALPWLNQHAPEGAQVWINVPGFVSSMALYQGFGKLRSGLELTGGREALGQADLCVVVNKPTEWGPEARGLVRAGGALYTEELGGAPLTWVFPGPHWGQQTEGVRP